MAIISVTIPLSKLDCGSAGIKNGNVRGTVLSADKKGLSGVSILLVRNGTPPIIRSTISDADGIYVFHNTPVGKYSLGYSKLGYKSILANHGNTEIKTSPENQIRTYVESGASIRIPPVMLDSFGPFGLAPVSLNLIDQITGEPVVSANIHLGNQSNNNSIVDGKFTMKLTIPPSEKSLDPVNLRVSAPGFNDLTDHLTIIPKQENSFTISLKPLMATLEGHIDFSSFPFASLDSVTTISVANIPSNLLEPEIESTGFFSIRVPVSTQTNTRKFDIKIHTRGFHPITIPGVLAPEAGATSILQTVRLSALTTPVRGKVVSRNGLSPIASGMNQAFIKELGISTSINGGMYFFQAIPTGINLTVTVFILNSVGRIERGSIDFLTTINGQGNFTLPTIVTKPIDS
tara:strand:+ start:336 stop:1544 length:1209 start_codon:yes stop_codon:yes gene_type:complete